MYARMRLLKGVNMVLYAGPLVAGMAGLGWGIVPPFVSIFVLWLMIVRPEQWPATNAEWLTGRALFSALSQVLSQLLLVTVLLGFGGGIVGLAGISPTINPMFPLGLSIAAIFLSRLFWDARGAAAAGVFLDEDAADARASHAAAEALAAIVPLLTLPEDPDETSLRQTLEEVLSGPAVTDRLHAVASAISTSGRSHAALRRALVVWATEPEIVAPGRVANAPLTAFGLSDGNPDLLRLYLPRALALVAAFPDRVSGFPTAATLRQAANATWDAGPNTDIPAYLRVDLRDGLVALASAVEAATAKPRPAAEHDARDSGVRGSPSPV